MAEPTSSDRVNEKRLAAAKSLDFVRDGMCIGLGSGTTAALLVELLGERVRQGLQIRAVPTSENTRRAAEAKGIALTSFDEVTELDLVIDGADEVDSELNLLKGGGGCLLREKIVASLSRQMIVIVDSRKIVPHLGAFPLPVEVVKFAWKPLAERLQQLGGNPALRHSPDGQPMVTDEGNYILDCSFGEIRGPTRLDLALNAMPGVMEHGLFIDIAQTVIVGRGDDVEMLQR